MSVIKGRDGGVYVSWFGIHLRDKGAKWLYYGSIIGLNITFLSLLFILLGFYSDLQYVDYAADIVGWETGVFFTIGYYFLYFILIFILFVFFIYNIRIVGKARKR